ncbi:MAG TPA: type II secretion system protein [Tepidisphaeraceae bacterium]|nr:type II secretion system protein [Tepidisphaeraceae bacterium]
MRLVRYKGFTLVELLVVIGIIGVLVSVLLPALGRARQASWAIKCASNLRSIGQAMTGYTAENKGFYPAAYIYVGMKLTPTSESPDAAINGYLHWSSYLYSHKDSEQSDSPFRSMTGWDMFQCPTIERGGLSPTNTFAGNRDEGQQNDDAAIIDKQSPRCAYTVNEAICPRNKFVLTFQGAVRTYHYVSAANIKQAAQTILATEWNPDWRIVAGPPRIDGGSPTGSAADTVCKSHRPISGYVGMSGELDLEKVAKDTFRNPPAPAIRRAKPSDLMSNPQYPGISASKTRLDWVGRNHYPAFDQTGFNIGKSNFLYVDGHVETKQIRETLAPAFEWGQTIYSMTPINDILPQ